MKGIIKYNQKYYKKAKRITNPKEGDLIKLECKRKSDYFKFNGIYTVRTRFREIHIPNYDGKGMTLCLKLGYNVFYSEFSILVEVERKKETLPMPAKEEKLCGYTI